MFPSTSLPCMVLYIPSVLYVNLMYLPLTSQWFALNVITKKKRNIYNIHITEIIYNQHCY